MRRRFRENLVGLKALLEGGGTAQCGCCLEDNTGALQGEGKDSPRNPAGDSGSGAATPALVGA